MSRYEHARQKRVNVVNSIDLYDRSVGPAEAEQAKATFHLSEEQVELTRC
jgi:hypothetical protein